MAITAAAPLGARLYDRRAPTPAIGDAACGMSGETPDHAIAAGGPRLEAHRRFLARAGLCRACGLWSPHINGLRAAVSRNTNLVVRSRSVFWSAMYDEKRLHRRVAPRLLELMRRSVPCLRAARPNCSAIPPGV